MVESKQGLTAEEITPILKAIANKPEVTRVVLEVGEVGKMISFGAPMAVACQDRDFPDDIRKSVVAFRQWIATETLKEIESQWPDGWWQAVRERWCPRWWLKRRPVRYRYERLEATALYPELSIPRDHTHVVVHLAKKFDNPKETT